MYYFALLFLTVPVVTQSTKGPCFEFPDNAYLEFRPNNLNISLSTHYSLEVNTTSEEGLIMYAEGEHDYEALYVSKGRLFYLLVNPSPSGVDSSIGGLYTSNYPVNNGSWIKVHVWRNWPVQDNAHGAQSIKTGLQLRNMTTGMVETHVDHLQHSGVLFQPSVFFGGVATTARHLQGTESADFVGQVRDMRVETAGGGSVHLHTYFHNYGGKVTLCQSNPR